MPNFTNRYVLLALGLAIVMPAPTVAQQAPAKKRYDPNERVCEDITMVGSRLAKKRFCGTRAEWADRRRQDREAVEKAQLGPCMTTHNDPNGKPSC